MLTQFIVWLNTFAGGLAQVALAPIAWAPGWLSSTIIAVVTGVLMLLIFKYTSNQTAIKQTRNSIKANLFALSLFNEHLGIVFRSQGRVLRGAGRLILHSLVPMLVMMIPMCLLLAQLSVWYQARPLAVGEKAVITLQLSEAAGDAVEYVQLVPSENVSTVAGPVRVPSKNIVCWDIEAQQPGQFDLQFDLNGESYAKEISIGEGFLPVSLKRPESNWSEALLYPREPPFPADSAVRSIEVAFPKRSSWTVGGDTWLIYWFAISMVAAFAASPLFKLNL